MKSFIEWVTGAPAPKAKKLTIVEQRLPGDLEIGEDEAEKRRLPDAWIFSESGWALLVESKISAAIDMDQIRGHLKTAQGRKTSEGQPFDDCRLICLSPNETKKAFPRGATHLTWAQLYQWAAGEARNRDQVDRRTNWAKRLTDYMEIAEQRMLEDEYLKEGTLTTFSGIHFNKENPYSYLDAKRNLKLLVEKLRTSKRLTKELGADLRAAGHRAITGKQADSVWDYIPLLDAPKGKNFTAYPHLSLSIHRDKVRINITVPNASRIKKKIKGALLDGGYDSFRAMIGQFERNGKKILDLDPRAMPIVAILQRHYLRPNAQPTIDASLKFDPRTALNGGNRVVPVEHWLMATFESLKNRRPNLQLDIGWEFFYASSKTIGTPAFGDVAEEAFLSCRPILKKLNTILLTSR